MHLSGSSTAEISNAVDCSANTVRLWINKYLRGGLNTLTDHRSFNHAPRRTNLVQDEVINEYFTEGNPFSTAANFVNVVQADIGPGIVRRRLNEMDIHSRTPAVKFHLRDLHREQRVQYARRYVAEPDEFWENVICVDEKNFSTSEDGRRRVWRGPNSRLKENCVVAKQHSGRISCNFWGCTSVYGVGVLRQVNRRFNAAEYVELLENDFVPYLNRIFPENEYEEVKVIQDNSRIHTARLTREWYERHPRITLLPHPPYSPDLNAIENQWALVVRNWRSGQELRGID